MNQQQADRPNPPEVSVIMGVYNQFDREVLLEAVNSILHQSLTNLEFIIYDDGSALEAASYLKEVAKLDDRILLIGQEENHGLAFSLNACIAAAKGTYIARMDADDISYPNRLLVQKKYLEEHPEVAWCGCNAELFDKNGIWGRRKMPEYPGKDDYLKYSPYVHPSVMYRREIFEANQGYLESEETLRCEDYEIFMRLRQAGLKGANIQQYLFCYREDGGSYHKRTWTFRIREAKCRYRNFKAMGILFPKGIWYVLRPIVGGLLPNEVIRLLKRKESVVHAGGAKAAVVSVPADAGHKSQPFGSAAVLSEEE